MSKSGKQSWFKSQKLDNELYTPTDLTVSKYIKHSSANMTTVELCIKLRASNIQFDVEYSPDRGKKVKRRRHLGYRGSRFDIVIIKNDYIVAIIETKSNNHTGAVNQIEKYAKHGVPVVLCRSIAAIDEVLQKIKEIYFDITTNS